jgi:hypothetical protein
MKMLIRLEKELPQFEADAAVYKNDGERPKVSLLREQPENLGAEKAFPLEEARWLEDIGSLSQVANDVKQAPRRPTKRVSSESWAEHHKASPSP